MRIYSLLLSIFYFCTISFCEAQKALPLHTPKNSKPNRAGCSMPTDVQYLDVNNVRALIMNGSDMWWNRNTGIPAYEVPYNRQKPGNNPTALFGGSIWVGGKDASSGLLKVAGQSYRQNGEVDYWSGPLDQNLSITANECSRWDRIWKVERTDINEFLAIYNSKLDSILSEEELAVIPAVIKEWPAAGSATAKGKNGIALNMGLRNYAPFIDVDGDGIYNFKKGDYPDIEGDQMLWYMINDVGNIKTSSATPAIGLEMAVSAFAFATNDVLNESTFYEFDIVNRGPSNLDSTYMSIFNCADFGDYLDDYIGCDINRSMAILYNGDNYDGGQFGYGEDIPMLGLDFLGGAKLRRIGLPDSTLGMTAFTLFTNVTHPNFGNEMYNLMSGKLINGNPFVKGCNPLLGVGQAFPFVYPDNFKECDPCNIAPGERNFINSTGPITLYPGAQNIITLGVIWVPSVGGGCPSFGKLQKADDYVQSIFDQGFAVPIGPMAPDVKMLPYDQKFIFYLNNPYGSNNYNEAFGVSDSSAKYQEKSILALKNGSLDSLYKFEGYIVYQMRDSNVKIAEMRNSDGSIDENKARIVFQCDKKNGIKNILNFENNPDLHGQNFDAKLMVVGANKGIQNNFEITKDAFGTGNKKLVNYKSYYYLVMAYAYNNFSDFNPTSPNTTAQIAYRESRWDARENLVRIQAIMPSPAFNNIYQQNQVQYGEGVEVKRLEGLGNSGLDVELADETEMSILKPPYFAAQPSYKAGKTPIQIKITNPDSIKYGDYKVWIIANGFNIDTANGINGGKASWFITRDSYTRVDTIFGEKSLENFNEQLLTKWQTENTQSEVQEDWGFSVGLGK